MLHHLAASAGSRTVGGLVLSPTRELTSQICGEAKKFCYLSGCRPVVVYGGADIRDQLRDLERGCEILVATPGRLSHVLVDAQLSLTRVEYVVFDEADRLFEMGFAVQIAGIMATMPDERQCLLFSATMPSILADFTRARLHEPRLIRLDLETKLSDALSVAFFKVRPHEKAAALVSSLMATHWTRATCSAAASALSSCAIDGSMHRARKKRLDAV